MVWFGFDICGFLLFARFCWLLFCGCLEVGCLRFCVGYLNLRLWVGWLFFCVGFDNCLCFGLILVLMFVTCVLRVLDLLFSLFWFILFPLFDWCFDCWLIVVLAGWLWLFCFRVVFVWLRFVSLSCC